MSPAGPPDDDGEFRLRSQLCARRPRGQPYCRPGSCCCRTRYQMETRCRWRRTARSRRPWVPIVQADDDDLGRARRTGLPSVTSSGSIVRAVRSWASSSSRLVTTKSSNAAVRRFEEMERVADDAHDPGTRLGDQHDPCPPHLGLLSGPQPPSGSGGHVFGRAQATMPSGRTTATAHP